MLQYLFPHISESVRTKPAFGKDSDLYNKCSHNIISTRSTEGVSYNRVLWTYPTHSATGRMDSWDTNT